MKFKVDENLPLEIASMLRDIQYDAMAISEQSMQGAKDPDVALVLWREYLYTRMSRC